MKLLIMTHNNERHFYLINEIIRNCDFEIKVITGGKNSQTKYKISWTRIRNFLLNRVYFISLRNLINEKISTESEYFGGQESTFHNKNKKHLLASVNAGESINDHKFVEYVSEFNPDVIIVMGTIIISKKIFTIAEEAINFHTGLSPYYRGGFANLWPIVNGEFNKCGFTIHKLTSGVDNGDIYCSGQIDFSENKTFSSINCDSIVLGTKFIIQILQKISIGQNFILSPQWQKGRHYINSDFNGFVAHRYFKNKQRNRGCLQNLEVFMSEVKTVELELE